MSSGGLFSVKHPMWQFTSSVQSTHLSTRGRWVAVALVLHTSSVSQKALRHAQPIRISSNKSPRYLDNKRSIFLSSLGVRLVLFCCCCFSVGKERRHDDNAASCSCRMPKGTSSVVVVVAWGGSRSFLRNIHHPSFSPPSFLPPPCGCVC